MTGDRYRHDRTDQEIWFLVPALNAVQNGLMELCDQLDRSDVAWRVADRIEAAAARFDVARGLLDLLRGAAEEGSADDE